MDVGCANVLTVAMVTYAIVAVNDVLLVISPTAAAADGEIALFVVMAHVIAVGACCIAALTVSLALLSLLLLLMPVPPVLLWL